MKLFNLALLLLAALGLCAFGAPPTLGAGSSDAPAALFHQAGGHGAAGGLHGEHGFTYSGTVHGVGPVASSGSIGFDGRGRVRASFTTVVNGTVFQGSFVGTYVVDADGLGSITIQLPWLGRQAHGNFVIVDEGRGTFFTCTDDGYTVTGSTRKT